MGTIINELITCGETILKTIVDKIFTPISLYHILSKSALKLVAPFYFLNSFRGPIKLRVDSEGFIPNILPLEIKGISAVLRNIDTNK